MHIAYVELSNVKSYKSSGRINFAKGINAIGGQNGTGKSTILEAIGFALFDARTHTSKNFIREGCKKGEIIVGFVDAVDERLYEVVRGIYPSPGTPYIYDPEIKKKLVVGKDDVYSWIKEHLRVSSAGDMEALFQDTIGVQQGLLTAPFQQSPRERKIKFDKLLQVDEYDDVHKWLAESEKYLRSQIADKRVYIEGIKGKLSGLPALQEEVKNLQKQIKATSEKLKKTLKEIDNIREKKEELDKTKDQMDKLASEIEAQQERITDLTNQHKEATKDLYAAQMAHGIVTKSQVGYQAFKDREVKLIDLENQRKERDTQQKRAEKVNRNILETETKTKSAEDTIKKIQQAEVEINRLTPILDEYHELEAELDTAETKVIRRQETNTRLKDETERLKKLNEELDIVHKDLLSRAEIESAIKDIEVQRTNTNKELALVKAQIDQFDNQLLQLNERQALLSKSDTAECPICLSPLDPSRMKELEHHYSNEIILLKQKLTSSKKYQKEISGNSRELETQYGSLGVQLGRLPSSTREGELNDQIKQQKKVVASWKEKFKAFTGLDEQINKLRTKKAEFGNIESQYAIHQDVVKERKKVEKHISDLLMSLKQFQVQMGEANHALHAYADLDETIQRIQLEKENSRADHDQYLSNQQTANQLEKRSKRVDEIQNQLTERTEESQSSQEKLTTLQAGYDQVEHKRVNSSYDGLIKEHGALESQVVMLNQQHLNAKNKIQSLLPLEKELRTREEELHQLNSVSDVLAFLRKTIREAGPYIVRQLLQAISEEADRIVGEILNDYTARLKWTDDYEITIEHQGYIREFIQLSGGEKMAAALAVRLALLREMSEIRIAFFDEPTANLDDERRNNLAEQMIKIKGFDQLFVISHDDTFEHQTDHVLHVYKENGTSYVTGG
jgi:exonuclease SbcC